MTTGARHVRIHAETSPGGTCGAPAEVRIGSRPMASSTSVRPTTLTWVLAVLGVLCLVVAAVYWTQPADALPSFFPGANAAIAAKHTKHGIAVLGLGIVLFIGAWMTTGQNKDAAPAS